MWVFIGILSFFGFLVLAVIALISVFKKTGKAKKQFLYSGILFAVFIAAMVASAATDPVTPDQEAAPDEAAEDVPEGPVAEEPVAEEPVAEEPVAEEPVAEEPVAQEPVADEPVEEPEGVSFDGNGTFAVNDEIQPGLYRAEDITYWARLSGFSGELEEILANGTPSGPAIVEIKKTDKGFQTMGSGEWTLIDDTYAPQTVTEFDDGTYIVGKDIEPGTYKSGDSVIYWARLKNFTGDLESIIANGTPTGAEIVEIKSSDKGFQTSGGGTWKKIE